MNARKSVLIIFVLLFVFLNTLPLITAEDQSQCAVEKLDVYYFYTDGCIHCAKAEKKVEYVGEKYEEYIRVHHLEVSHNLTNYQLFHSFAEELGIPKPEVPLVVFADRYLVGGTQIERNLELEVAKCQRELKPPPTLLPGSLKSPERLTWSAVIIGGLIDGINPCAIAVLIFLITYLTVISRKRVLKNGLVYISTVYVTYFLAGIGLLSAFQFSGATELIFYAAAILIILGGVVNIKDFFWFGRGFSLKIPASKLGTIQKYIENATLPAAVILGFLVSMFELPCTGGIYLAILSLLSKSDMRLEALPYLAVYNFLFVLPLAVILVLVYFGLDPSRVKTWHQEKRKWMRLSMGMLMILLGLAMLLGLF